MDSQRPAMPNWIFLSRAYHNEGQKQEGNHFICCQWMRPASRSSGSSGLMQGIVHEVLFSTTMLKSAGRTRLRRRGQGLVPYSQYLLGFARARRMPVSVASAPCCARRRELATALGDGAINRLIDGSRPFARKLTMPKWRRRARIDGLRVPCYRGFLRADLRLRSSTIKILATCRPPADQPSFS